MRTMSRMKSDVLGTYLDFQRMYGDVVSFRTGPYRLFIFYHPEQVRETLVTHAKSFIRLPRVMQTFAQWNGNSVLIAEGEQWIRQRRLVQPAFQPSRLDQYGNTIVDCAVRLVETWEQRFDREGYVDVRSNETMIPLTLEIICKTMFDCEVADASPDIAKAVAILSEVAFHEMQSPMRLPTWVPTPFKPAQTRRDAGVGSSCVAVCPRAPHRWQRPGRSSFHVAGSGR